MSDRIEPALPPALWPRARQWKSRIAAMITLEGGNDSELGVPDLRVDGSNQRERDAVHYAAAIALLNDDLPDTDDRKITREWLSDLERAVSALGSFASADSDLDRVARLNELIARLEHQAAAIASLLPPDRDGDG
ncbi:MAG: hypothetical protein ABJF01_20825 [bacterium]